jgi:hypothetical protein
MDPGLEAPRHDLILAHGRAGPHAASEPIARARQTARLGGEWIRTRPTSENEPA